MLLAVLLAEQLTVNASRGASGGGGAAAASAKRSAAETAAAWGIDIDVLSRVEELGRRVGQLHAGWVKSRERKALAESIKLQAEIVSLAPKSWEMRASLANLHYYAGEDALAEHQARQAVTLNPLSAGSQKLLGRILVQVGRADEGLKHLHEALYLAPDDGECWYKVGTVMFERGALRDAVVCFRAAGALRGDSLALLSAAHTLHKLKDSSAAFKLYHAAVRADATNHDAWTDFAFALSEAQHHAWAEWAQRKALALRPTGENYFSVGNHLLSQKRYADARELYLQGAALSPDNPGLMHNLGFACHLSGDQVGAVDAALRTCQIYLSAASEGGKKLTVEEEGRSPMYIAGLGNALRRAGQLELAVDVMVSLRQPSHAALSPRSERGHLDAGTGVVSNGKIIINDNIRIDNQALRAALAKVLAWQAERDAAVPSASSPGDQREEGGAVRRGARLDGRRAVPAFSEGPLVGIPEESGAGRGGATAAAGRGLVPKAVITYLIGRRTEHYLDLLDSLEALQVNFLRQYPYPVIVFHEGLGPDEMEKLRGLYERLLFHRLDRSFLFPPDHIDEAKVPSIIGGHATVGYRHMCRFFSGTMFNYPLLAPYDWFWRLDSDSFLLAPLTHDPFRRMLDGRFVYGFMGLGREDEYLTTGLWNATTEYMRGKGMATPPPLLQQHLESPEQGQGPQEGGASPAHSPKMGTWDRSYYYTNFEIGHLPFFRGEAYQSYFRHLDAAGGFYYYRWGDAPIRLLGVSMHAAEHSVCHFDDIPYSHKVYVVAPPRG